MANRHIIVVDRGISIASCKQIGIITTITLKIIVFALAASQNIITLSAGQQITASSTFENIVTAASCEGIIPGTTTENIVTTITI